MMFLIMRKIHIMVDKKVSLPQDYIIDVVEPFEGATVYTSANKPIILEKN